MLQKLKIKIRQLDIKQGIGMVLLSVFCFALLPNFTQAAQGIADDGKDNRTFDITDVVLRPEISAATGLDCGNTPLSQLKGNIQKIEQLCKFNTKGFYTIGNNVSEKEKSYLLVKYSIYLEKPGELNVAPKSFGDIFKDFTFGLVGPSAPKVDYVKISNGFYGFGVVNHPILGIGYAVGLSGQEKCEKKVLSYPWEKEEFINSCNFGPRSNGGKQSFEPESEVTWKTGSPIRTVYFAYGPDNNFDGLAMNETGKDYKMVFWPSLYLNVGNRSVLDKYVVSAAATAAAQMSTGVSQKALDIAKQGVQKGDDAIKALVDFFKGSAPQAARAFSEAELQALAKGAINWAEDILTWPGNAQSVEQVATRAAELAAKEAIKNGAKVEQATALIGNITKDLAATAGMDAAAATNLAEQAAVKAGIAAGGTVEAAAGGARAASKFGKIIKFAGPAAQVIGPLFNGVQLTFSIFSFSKEHFDIYDSKNTLTLRLYATEAEAQSHANDPAPVDASNMGSTPGTSSVGKSGSPLLGFINELIAILTAFVQELIYLLFTALVVPLIEAMLSIRTYTDQFAAVIYPGWIVVRNVCNILFIIAIMAIAMGTLLRLDGYQFRSMLINLIVAALLVNFSLFVGQAVLGVADTVQSQFLPNNKAVIRSLGADLVLNNREAFSRFARGDFASQGYFSQTVVPLFMLVVSAGTFMVFLAIAAFLAIRVVMLWILLMVSPVAYAAGALPSTAHYREEWWETFLKYAFFTPVMAFCLNMAAVIVNAQKTNPVLRQISSAEFSDNNLSSFVFNVASNILLLIFLLVALQAAEKFSIIGAGKITDFAKGGMFALPKIAAGYGARKWNEFTANTVRGHGRKVSFGRAVASAALNPVAFAKAWAKEREKKDHRAQEKAELAALEVVQQRFASPKTFLFGGGKIKQHILAHDKHEEDDEAKNFANMSRENVARNAAEISTLGFSEDDMASKRGVIKLAMHKGYIDDVVEEAYQTKEGRQLLEKMKKYGLDDDDFEEKEITDENGNKVKVKSAIYSHKTRRALYKAMFGWVGDDEHGHFKDHAAGRLITEEGEEEGMNTGHLEYMTDMYFDVASGEYKFYKLRKVVDPTTGKEMFVSDGETVMAGEEIGKKDSRTQARIAWHALISSNGRDFSRAIFRKVAKAFRENPGFMQERQTNKLFTGKSSGDVVVAAQKAFKDKKVLNVDPNFANVIKMMMDEDEGATATMIQRFVNDTSTAAIADLMKKGFTVNGEKINFKNTSVGGISGTVTEQLKEGKAINTQIAGASAEVLKNYDSVDRLPDFNVVVNGLVATGKVNRGEAVKVTFSYLQQLSQEILTKRKIDTADVIQKPSTRYANVEVLLSGQQLSKFLDVIKDATNRGLADSTRFASDTDKTNAIKKTIEEDLNDKDVKKSLGNHDLTSIFNSEEFAKEILNALK